MKKTILFVGAFLAFQSAIAQNGLENVVVEKYYISDLADSTDAATNGAVSPLRVGSTTYRVYADLLPGYTFIQLYGTPEHSLMVNTTTDFYNDPNYGSTLPQGTSLNNTKKNTTLIDSWFSVGGVCAGKMGVLKTEDTDGTIGNLQNILANADASAGIPINGVDAQDGLMPGTPLSPNVLGITSELDIFDQSVGNSFLVNNGTIAALGGVEGVTPSNMVLIGQFTTDGTFSFELNIQIGTPTPGESETYVASSPTGNEISIPTLIYESEPNTNDLTEEISSLNVSVFPNPANDNLTIELAKVANNFSYVVTDVQGNTVVSHTTISGSKAATVDVSNLTAGIYFIEVTASNFSTTTKVVKQ